MGLSIQLANNLHPATPTFRTNISRKWITTAQNFFIFFFSSGWKSRLMDALVKVKLKPSSAKQLSGRNSMTLAVSGHFSSSVFIEFRCAGRFADFERLQVTADAFSPHGLRTLPPRNSRLPRFLSAKSRNRLHLGQHTIIYPTHACRLCRQLDLIKVNLLFASHRHVRVMRNVFTASSDHDRFTLTSPSSATISKPPEFFATFV